MRSVAVVVLLAAVGALAKPDCNACFMKNAGKDKHRADATTPAPPHALPGQAATTVGGEVPTAAVYEDGAAGAAAASLPRLSQFRAKRTAGWGQEARGRLRGVLLASSVAQQLGARPDADAGDSGQWWEEAPSDMEWPVTRDAWGELDGEGAAEAAAGRPGPADQATDAVADAGVWGDIRGHALRV
ncbi:hypothetical protein ONE63_008750 [Megalurothrips usitatus]|uniref:Uncharacterized protein n=1 Tax=Megalurothrips usitatus TaxID=439358 RepID=A0AAV7XQI2_9NEOP|nr:hypothetical protein ONE63_008750 [Megalurothrips usitatus]